MNNSFKENFQWVTLISVTAIYGYYFAKVIPTAGPDITVDQIALFGVLVALLVVVHIIGAMVLIAAARFQDPTPDERDKLVNLMGRSSASWMLAVGIFAGMAAAWFTEGNFWVMHVLLASLVLSQLVESATQIFHYRRGF